MSTDSSGFDQYQRIQIQGVSSVDGTSPQNIEVNPTTGAMQVEASIDTTGLATTITDTNTTTIAGDTTSIDAKIPALGQALAAASVPVVLTAAQLTTLTPVSTVTANAGTNLNTSALLTTTAHDAAFGTAGSADAQVRSIQGIASMTPVQVSQATASNLNATVVQATGTNLHTVVDSGTVTTVTTLTGGGIAHDNADSGNPHKMGLKAYSPDGTTPGTAVAEADRSDAKGDLDGRLFTNDEHPRWWSYHEDSSSALTDATVRSSPGAGFQIVITNIIVSTGAATAMNFFLEESTTKIFGAIYLEAVAGRGFCTPAGFKKHITAATAVTITTSAAIAHSVDIQGYIQAV